MLSEEGEKEGWARGGGDCGGGGGGEGVTLGLCGWGVGGGGREGGIRD